MIVSVAPNAERPVAPTPAAANDGAAAGESSPSLPELADLDPDLAAQFRKAHDKWWGAGGIARWLEEHSKKRAGLADDEKGGGVGSAKKKPGATEDEAAAARAAESAARTVAAAMEEAARRRPAAKAPPPPPADAAAPPPLLLPPGADAPGAGAAADPLALARLSATAKSDALRHLRRSGGDTSNPRFLSALRTLTSIYRGTGNDARRGGGGAAGGLRRGGGIDIGWAGDVVEQLGGIGGSGPTLEGDWTILSKPSFPGCLGTNDRGEYTYGLGRMSFDMFRPTNLRCSIRNIRTEIGAVDVRAGYGELAELPAHVPASLREEIERFERGGGGEGSKGRTVLRTYNIVINFTIEPRDPSPSSSDDDDDDRRDDGPDPADPSAPAPSCPLHASMRNEGYMLSDPDIPNRLTVWFTGGELGPRSKSGNAAFDARRRPRGGRGRGGDLPSSVVAEEPAGSASAPSCPLVLHECRRRSEFCLLHGVGTRRKPVGLPSQASLQWEDIFGPDDNWKRTWGEKAKALAAKVILGAEVPRRMEEDGTMRYRLHRPVGGHGSTFVDVLYLDRDLSITRGNAGTVFVQARCSADGGGGAGPPPPAAPGAGRNGGAAAARKPPKRSVVGGGGAPPAKARAGAVRKAAAA